MPKKTDDEFDPPLEEGIPQAPRFSKHVDKYKFSKFKKIGQSMFYPIGDKQENRLRWNLYGHMRMYKDRTGNELELEKSYEDPFDKSTPVGFRIRLIKKK